MKVFKIPRKVLAEDSAAGSMQGFCGGYPEGSMEGSMEDHLGAVQEDGEIASKEGEGAAGGPSRVEA